MAASKPVIISSKGRHKLVALAVTLAVSALLTPASSWAQSPPPAVPTAPVAPTIAPEAPRAPAPAASAVPAPTTAQAPAPEIQPFVGIVTGTRVNIRSGPGANWYTMGQLQKGDTVNVVGVEKDYDRIEPPAGTLAYASKDLGTLSPDGRTLTISADYVRARAASALLPASDYAVLATLRKGETLSVEGQTDKYYVVDAPRSAEVFISADFVRKAPAGTDYLRPTLSVPGHTPPLAHATPVASPQPAPSTQTSAAAPAPSAPPPESTETSAAVAAPQPAATTAPAPSLAPPAIAAAPQPATQPRIIPVAPQPAHYDQNIYTRYTALNEQYQAETQKPLLERDLSGLLAKFQDLISGTNVPPTVQQSAQARIDALNKQLTVQQMARQTTAQMQDTNEQSATLNQTWQKAASQYTQLQQTAPPLAQGILRTSAALRDRYVLINPETGRVEAYVVPDANIDLSKLLNEYIALRGTITSSTGSEVKVIHPSSATLLPRPATQPAR